MTVAKLREVLSPNEIAIGAAFYHDGETQEQIADRIGLSIRAVNGIIANLKRRVAAHDMPVPRRFTVADTRHVRNLDSDAMADLLSAA